MLTPNGIRFAEAFEEDVEDADGPTSSEEGSEKQESVGELEKKKKVSGKGKKKGEQRNGALHAHKRRERRRPLCTHVCGARKYAFWRSSLANGSHAVPKALPPPLFPPAF